MTQAQPTRPCCCLLGRAALGAGLLLALLALLTGPNGSAQEKKPLAELPDDLKLVPADATLFITVRVADLLASPLVSKLLPAFGTEAGGPFDELNRLPVAPKTVERATWAVPSKTNKQALIVRTLAPYDRDAVLRKARLRNKLQVKGHTLYCEDKRGPALHFVDGRTFLSGAVEVITAILDAASEKRKPGPLASARALAAGKHHVVIALRLDAQLDSLFPPAPVPPPKAKKVGPAEKNVAPRKPPELPRTPRGAFSAISFDGKEAKEEVEAKRPLPGTFGELLDEPSLLAVKPLYLARSSTMTLDLGMEVKAQARLVYADEDTARDGVVAVNWARYVAREALAFSLHHELGMSKDAVSAILKKPLASLRAAKVERNKTVVQATIDHKVDAVALASIVAEIQKASERARRLNHLKQLGLAMHSFASTNGNRFPAPAIYGKDGKALLSWRVAILPFIEQQPLYNQFRLDEPWDSAHNKKLLAKMPALFAPPPGAKTRPHTTFYRVFTGPHTIFPEPDVKRVGQPCPGLLMFKVLDGTSNTILIVEAGEAVPWTKPEELAYDAKKPLPKLGGASPDRFYATMADGAVYAFKTTIPEKVLRATITADDAILPEWQRWVIGRRPRAPGRFADPDQPRSAPPKIEKKKEGKFGGAAPAPRVPGR